MRRPGLSPAEGPAIEASITGGKYLGRLDTSESHANASSAEASMVWVCSYSLILVSFRGPWWRDASRRLSCLVLSRCVAPQTARHAGGRSGAEGEPRQRWSPRRYLRGSWPQFI